MKNWLKYKPVRNILFIIVIFIALLVATFFIDGFSSFTTESECLDVEYSSFENSDTKIKIVRAVDSDERAQGLMFIDEISDTFGMLFVFEDEVVNGFWMKNTLIPLDMIFLNSFMEVVDINKDAQPCGDSECLSYIPLEKYQYVLEINSGLSDQYGIEVGDLMKIESVKECPEGVDEEV